MPEILVVDDEQSISWGLAQLARREGHHVHLAASAEQALEKCRDANPEVVILDVRLPGMDGLSAIKHFRRQWGEVPIIVITAYGDLETAVRAVREGAFEYVLKPFDVAEIKACLDRALTSRHTHAARTSDEPGAGFIGRSPAMQLVFKRIALAAATDSAVLLCGESGTGKELAARAIHRYSSRANGPFVAVNVAALSPTLAEAELFGHTRGAFTGAETSREGLLIKANGGTLFLDEVADIPPHTQVKLLRALEEGEVLPVGSDHAVPTDFRLVSATHQHLEAKIRDGSFRHDLYFRLCAFSIEMPALRQRPEDIGELAHHFLNVTARLRSGPPPVLSAEAEEELARRPWFGNARELRNAIEHALTVARGGVIELHHLPQTVLPASGLTAEPAGTDDALMRQIREWTSATLARADASADVYERFLRLVEVPFLEVFLERHRGQCSTAARDLGLHRTTLRKKLDKYGIQIDER
jgi:two-component system nitrogen regulation response regulator GlnG